MKKLFAIAFTFTFVSYAWAQQPQVQPPASVRELNMENQLGQAISEAAQQALANRALQEQMSQLSAQIAWWKDCSKTVSCTNWVWSNAQEQNSSTNERGATHHE